MTLDAAQALGLLPQDLRSELLAEFAKITRNYREGRSEAAELDGGRLCEVVLTIVDGFTRGGAYAATASKLSNFGVKRVLDTSLSLADETLLLLYAEPARS